MAWQASVCSCSIKEAMVSTKEKESFKKLVKFIVIVGLTSLAFLQISSLIYLFSIKKTTVTRGLSKESAPIPALTACIKTHKFTREEVLAKYKVKTLTLDADPEREPSYFGEVYVKSQWEDFDWTSVSLKQLYDEALLYPRQIVKTCEVGDNYNCTENEGINHLWTNVLIRGYSCSTLKLWMKVAYGETMRIYIDFEHLKQTAFYYKFHDNRKSFPRYFRKYLHHEYEDARRFTFTFTVKKEELLSDDRRSCSADSSTDHIQCEDDCFEKLLLQDNSSCLLPWMMTPGRQCSSFDEAVAMVNKEKLMQNIQCDCQRPCMQFSYIAHTQVGVLYWDASLETAIDNKMGIETLEESYMYTFLDLLANCGGSVGVFFSVSFVWLLQKIITTFYSFRCSFPSMASCNAEYVVKYLLTATFLACFSIAMYEGFYLVLKYLQDPKILSVDRPDPTDAPVPNALFCNYEETEAGTALISYPHSKLHKNYAQLLYRSPMQDIIECRVDNETCIGDESSFSWETVHATDCSCSMLYLNGGHYKELEILFDDTSNNKFYMCLTLSNTVPKYRLIENWEKMPIQMGLYTTVVYKADQTFNLPPCTENYNQCLETCWEQLYLKEDLCSPPEMSPKVKNQTCKTAEEFWALTQFTEDNRHSSQLCKCNQQCSDVTYVYTASQTFYDEDATLLKVSLVSYEFTRTSEEWAYPFTSLMAGIGGILGLFTGLSFLSILLDSVLKILALQKKRSAEILLIENVWKGVVYLMIWSCMLQQMYVSLLHYLESPVQLNEEIDKESVIVLPHFTLCYGLSMLYPWQGHVVGVSGINEYVYELEEPFIVTDLDSSWFNINDYLTDCNFFGIPCNKQKGEFHEWHNVTDFNGFCARLEIKPLKSHIYRDNKVVFTVSEEVGFYVSNAEEHRKFYLVYALDDVYAIKLTRKTLTTLQMIQYELLEEKPNNCNNRLGYNKRTCLDECVLDYIQETFKCRFPWMKSLTNLPICIKMSQYDFIFSINSTFLDGCHCQTSCHFIAYNLHLDVKHPILTENKGIIEIKIIESKKVFKEMWSYTAPQCLADLGGLMSFFTGMTLYGVCFSIDLYFLNLWQLVWKGLKSLRLGILRISK